MRFSARYSIMEKRGVDMRQDILESLALIAGSYNMAFHLYRADCTPLGEKESVKGSAEGSFDGGIRAWCSAQYNEREYLEKLLGKVETGELVQLTDSFGCRYLLLRIEDPEHPQAAFLGAGPYLDGANSEKLTGDLAKRLHWNPERTRSLYEYRNTVPVVQDEGALLLMFRRLAAPVSQGTDTPELLPVVRMSEDEPFHPDGPSREQSYDQSMAASMIERRYQAENAWLDALLTGDQEYTGTVLRRLSRYQMPERFNSLRGSQNMAIILNTLCRKNLERAAVHPAYIDQISREFSSRIEGCVTMREVQQLQREMVRRYCALVRSYAVKGYSPLIQQVMNDVFLHLDGEISLHALAGRAGVSDSYLSARFKEETGETLSQWVRGRRVERAKELLSRENPSIAQVAEQVGVLDVSYFIRLFRKETGMTPGEYRAQSLRDSAHGTIRRGE